MRGEVPHLLPSENDYDWLGSGIYFWEANPQRALDFATEHAAGALNSKGTIRDPFVLGAILDLGRCLDLRDAAALSEVRRSYDGFLLFSAEAQIPLPRNLGHERKLRKLDCAVMNFLHSRREGLNLLAYDTVRADFVEGGELYPGAGFRQQDHIQLCVRDTASILGYFRPIV